MISILGDVEAIKKLGSGVKSQRLRRNLTQAHLARVAGVSLPTYRKIEVGDGRIEFRHVVKVLAALGYSNAVENLIPEQPAELKLDDLLSPERKHASPVRRHGKTS